MKTQVRMIVASVIVIALALTAVSGITYSWFSDTEEMDIDITTGSVAIGMELVQLKDKSSYNRDATTDFTTNYTFGVTATAAYTAATTEGNAKLTLSKLADNDALLVTFKVTNTSTIDTVYRVSASTSGNLARYVETEFTLGGKTTNDATAWTDALVSSGDGRNVTGTLLIKFNSDGVANGSTDNASIALKAEVYQANTTDLPELTVSQTVAANETVSKTFNNGNTQVSSVGLTFTANTADTYEVSSITTAENSSYTITSGSSNMTVISGIAVTGSEETDLSSQQANLTFVLDSALIDTSASPTKLLPTYTILHQQKDGTIDTGFTLSPQATGTELDAAGEYILTSNSDGTYTMDLYVSGFSAYLAVLDANAIVDGKYVKMVSDENVANNIETVLNAASKVTLLDDFSYTDYALVLTSDLTLDLNGHTVELNTSTGFPIQYVTVVLNGNVTIIGTEPGSTFKTNQSALFGTQKDNVNLTINGGTYSAANSVINYTGGWTSGSKETYTGTVTINSGTFCVTGDDTEMISMLGGNLNINGGNFDGKYQACLFINNATTVINGGSFSGGTYQINKNGGSLIINNGTFIANSGANGTTILNIGGGQTTINGGTYTAKVDSDKSAYMFYIGTDTTSVMKVTGGTFTLVAEGGAAGTLALFNLALGETGKILCGGTYNVDPTSYVAEGYTVKNNGDGTWIVESSSSS